MFYDDLRKERCNEYTSVDEVSNRLEQPAVNVEHRMDMTRALTVLRPEERTAITLYFVEDLAVEKIAEIMNVPEGTIKSHLHRGKQKLADYLKQNGYDGME